MAFRYEDDDRDESPVRGDWDDEAADDARWNPAAFEADAGQDPAFDNDNGDDFDRVGVEDPAQMSLDTSHRSTRGRDGRGGGPLTWIAGAAVLVVVALALVWGVSGIGRQEPTPTPTPTEASVFRPAATPTAIASVVIAPTTAATATPGPAASGSIRIGGSAQVINSAPQGISLRAGAGLSYVRLTTLTDGTQLTVLDPPAGFADAYPTVVDNFTWWRVRTPDGTIGWVASAWLAAAN